MNCFFCGSEVRWNNDFDTEDITEDSQYLIVSMYQCDECNAWYEVFHSEKEENDGSNKVGNRSSTHKK